MPTSAGLTAVDDVYTVPNDVTTFTSDVASNDLNVSPATHAWYRERPATYTTPANPANPVQLSNSFGLTLSTTGVLAFNPVLNNLQPNTVVLLVYYIEAKFQPAGSPNVRSNTANVTITVSGLGFGEECGACPGMHESCVVFSVAHNDSLPC